VPLIGTSGGPAPDAVWLPLLLALAALLALGGALALRHR
jgi:hypothetical protein